MWTLSIYFVLWNCRSTYPTFMREKIKCEVCLFPSKKIWRCISPLFMRGPIWSLYLCFYPQTKFDENYGFSEFKFSCPKKLMCKNSLQQVSRCNLGSWKSIGGTLFWIPSGLVEYMGLLGVWFVHKEASINDVRFEGGMGGGSEMTQKNRTLEGENQTLGVDRGSKIVKNRRTSFMDDP